MFTHLPEQQYKEAAVFTLARTAQAIAATFTLVRTTTRSKLQSNEKICVVVTMLTLARTTTHAVAAAHSSSNVPTCQNNSTSWSGMLEHQQKQ